MPARVKTQRNENLVDTLNKAKKQLTSSELSKEAQQSVIKGENTDNTVAAQQGAGIATSLLAQHFRVVPTARCCSPCKLAAGAARSSLLPGAVNSKPALLQLLGRSTL